MKYSKILLCFLVPAAMFAAPNKEILELSRDVNNLQDQVRTMQRTLDEKVGQMQLQLTQALEALGKNNTSIAVLQSGINDRMSEQGRNLIAPVAGLNSKVDQMGTDFRALRESVDDLSSRMQKLQAQLTDLANTIKIMQNPPTPPPAGTTQDAGSGNAPVGGATPPAGMSARQLYDQAQRDRSSGNFDLAMQGFDAYLKYYPTGDLAPNAQFFIGQVYYDKGDFANSIKAFDSVLEKYSENSKTADAMYMKGMALWKSGQPTAAGKEFLNVIQKYPRSEVAPKAREARKALGLSVPSASGASPKTAAHKKRR